MDHVARGRSRQRRSSSGSLVELARVIKGEKVGQWVRFGQGSPVDIAPDKAGSSALIWASLRHGPCRWSRAMLAAVRPSRLSCDEVSPA